MKVIAVIAQKGGSGKTTLAVSLAVAAHRAGKSVAVIDLDPQASACKWGDRRNGDPVIVSVQAARLPQTLTTAQQNAADLVLIDTPPRAADAALAAAQAADLILIPCRATVKDLETLQTTQQLIASTGTTAPVVVVLNGVTSTGPLRQDAEKFIRDDLHIDLAGVALGQRVDFTYADAAGQAVQEYAPSGKAAREIEQLYKFTTKLLHKRTSTQETIAHG